MSRYDTRSLSRYAWVTFVIIAVTIACVLLQKDEQTVVNEEKNITEMVLTSNISSTLPVDGFPRVLITSPCSGSSATMRFTRSILQAHGYKVPFGGEPMRVQYPWVIKTAKERLKAKKIDHEPTITELAVEGIVLKTETVTKNGGIFLFKISQINKANLETLKKLGAKFAYTYRGNYLDRAVCVCRDCFDKGKLGHQVYENGTDSDKCFGRRAGSDENVMASFDDTEVLITEMQRWEKEDYHRSKNYKSLYRPAKIAEYEDLFKFEYTDDEKVFDNSVQTWMAFLKNFAEIQLPIVRRTLRPHKNSRPPPAPFKEKIYNFDKIEGILNETRFKKYLSN